MFSLPSLAPTDAHTLWYQSSTSAPLPTPPTPPTNSPSQPPPQRRQTATNPRTPLTRLRLDEEYIALRKSHITTYGSTWLKPPGLPKTLHQLREEEREARDHAEALRREALAQELAEAEARDEEVVQELSDEEDGDEGAVDLDAEIPDAVPDESSLPSDSDNESEDEEDESENPAGEGLRTPPPQAPRAPIPNTPTGEQDLQSPARRARIGSGMLRGERNNALARWMVHSRPEVAEYRDAAATRLLRPPPALGERGMEMGMDLEEEDEPLDPAQMLQESDLYHEPTPAHPHATDQEMEMDLDADIPDADDAGGYEHTDSDEELSSSEEEEEEEESEGEAVQGRGMGGMGGGGGFGTSIVRSDGTQNSLDFNGIGRSSGFSQGSESAGRGGGRGARRS